MLQLKNQIVKKGVITMTMQENANLIELLAAIGLKDHIGDFILGVEGRITIEEAAKRCNEARKS